MRAELVPLLRCPACASGPLRHVPLNVEPDGETTTGVLSCPACENWFPIEDGILELLHANLAYTQDRISFWEEHRERLRALGLHPPGGQHGDVEDPAVRGQQAHFDWYADNVHQTYDDYAATPFWRAADAIAFGEWRREIRSGSRLLDVGCAQGRSTFHLIDLDLHIVAFDISRSLIRQARKRLRRTPVAARVDFFVADATRFPLIADSFDYALTYGVLHHLPDPAKGCEEILRVLRTGGVYFGSENNTTAFRRLFDLLQKIWPLWHEEAGAEPLISAGDLRRWLEPRCHVDFRTSVYVPPHFLNWFSARTAESILRWLDRATSRVAHLRDQGGLLLFRAEKRGGGSS